MKRKGSTKMCNVTTAAEAVAIFYAALPREQKEERVYMLPLDAEGKALAKPILISVGSMDGTTTIDAGEIFREALKAGAEEIIVAHNHPSGDLRPSPADYATTKRLNDGADIIGLEFIDHIILGSSDSVNGARFVSMKEVM